jgi:ABC-type antimicrobial peptide transport system permease subunit
MLAIKQELLSQSAIESVTTSSQPIVNIGSMCSECADWPGHDTSYQPKIAQLSADADFQRTLQLQLREGRWFRDGAGVDKKSFILNETAVKDFKLSSPATGQTFIFKGDTGQVIGVVKDFTYKSMHEKMGPLIIFNNPNWRNQFTVRTRAKNASLAITGIAATWKKMIPGSPFEYNFLDDTFNNLYKKDQQTSLLILAFALIAVTISAMGLFGLAAFAAAQRTREIGIRKVLGASVTGITTLLSKDFVKLVCVAILIATPLAAWAMQQWLQDFAYRIAISWWMFAAAGLFALFIALFTISFQAIRAAAVNPVRSLRTE